MQILCQITLMRVIYDTIHSVINGIIHSNINMKIMRHAYSVSPLNNLLPTQNFAQSKGDNQLAFNFERMQSHKTATI